MWVLSWKKYGASKLATFVSVIGALTRYGGVMCLCAGLVLAGIISFAIGIGFHFLAEYINKSKVNKLTSKAATNTASQPVQQKTNITANTATNAAAKPGCPKCGAKVLDGSKFCNECGSKIEAQAPQHQKMPEMRRASCGRGQILQPLRISERVECRENYRFINQRERTCILL